MSDAQQFDAVIVGGGMVGLLLARLLEQETTALRIGVIEPDPPVTRAADAPLDLRVSALSPVSLELLDRAGALPLLPEHTVQAYDEMRVWQDGGGPDGERALSFSAAELGAATLGSIVENMAVREALWALVSESAAIELITAPATALTHTDNACVVSCGDREIHARLLVGADGARSWVRRQLEIDCREHAYRQNAMVAHLATQAPHANTAWQKFLPDGPVALLPLADGRCSLVWSHPESRTDALLSLPDDEFAEHLCRQVDGVLGKLQCTTPRASFPLLRGHAQAYTGPRFALLGDAAHRVHPLAGQGANLGFLDAVALAEELGRHLQHRRADPGDPLVLRRYERQRKGDNALTLGVMDGLNALFRSPLAGLAGAGLGIVDRAGPVKRLLADYAMGAAGSRSRR